MNPSTCPVILGLGSVAVDDLLYVDAYPAPDGKVRVLRRQRQCGGQTGTALVAAARLGVKASYAGVLGDDPLSHYVLESLGNEGIDTSQHVRRPDALPAHATIIVDQSAKTRSIFASVDGAIGADETRPDARVIRSADVLLVDHHGIEGSLLATQIARAAGIPVVADLERKADGPFAELLAAVDHLVLPEQIACELTGATNAAAATQSLWSPTRAAVVVTCGQAGCWYLPDASGRGPQHCPAFEVDVVDTTGCGDVFHGAYAVGLAQKDDLPRRVSLASATAAIKATRRGGQAGIPNRQQVDAFLAARG